MGSLPEYCGGGASGHGFECDVARKLRPDENKCGKVNISMIHIGDNW